jgi:hypothetical protein
MRQNKSASVTIVILDIIHRPVFYLKTRRFGDWILSSSSSGTYLDGPNINIESLLRQRLALSIRR